MAHKNRRKQNRAKSKPNAGSGSVKASSSPNPSPSTAQNQAAPKQHRIVAVMPGALLLRMAPVPGVPDAEKLDGRQLFALNDSPAFSSFSDEERSAVISSLMRTAQRARYHYLRFLDLLAVLDERRKTMPGEIHFDTLTDILHFELQSLCGAARTAVDELIYIIARRHDVEMNKARRSPWDASELVSGTNALSAICDVSEVRFLRSRKNWFEQVNAYRNSVFHNGWRHGSGHFAPSDPRQAAQKPALNARLLPDVSSLRSRVKPFEWTWNEGTLIENVAADVHDGLRSILSHLCEHDWSTSNPSPGAMPLEDQPNLLVVLAVPGVFVLHGTVIVPVFDTQEKAREFQRVCPSPTTELELIELPVSSLVTGKPAVTFSLRKLERSDLPLGAETIEVLVNPVPKNAEWTIVEAQERILVSVGELVSKTDRAVSIPLPSARSVFIWRIPDIHDWID